MPAAVKSALRIKHVLAEHDVSARELAACTEQTGSRRKGRAISPSALSAILNYNRWPTTTPPEVLQEQIQDYLLSRGVSATELQDAWQPDEDAPTLRRSRNWSRAHVTVKPVEQYIEIPETEMLTAAAKKHFRLFVDPFQDDVQGPDDVYAGPDQRYIRESMMQTAKHGGFMAVIGESGAGKTTLRRDLLDRIAREDLSIVAIQPRVIDKTKLNASMICDAVISDLAPQEKIKLSLEAKARQIERLLIESSRAGNRHVLIIEEAHDLTISTLKYLKRFYELEDGFRKLISIILIGQPELHGLLNEKQNHSAREVIRRIEIATLDPMDPAGIEAYLRTKFEHERIKSRLDDVFDADAYGALYNRLTLRIRGVNAVRSRAFPLSINNLVKSAMNEAAKTGSPRVSAELLEDMR